VDDATIEAAQRGDRRAQAQLLHALQDPWFRFCLSLVRNVEDAKDATQEAALRFLKALPSFRGQSKLQTFAMGIALNVVREKRRERDAQTDAAALRLSEARTEHESSKEEAELLRQSVDQLPDRQREAVILRFFEQMSVEETAAAMKCAEGTVKASVHQALKALKGKLSHLM